MVGTEYDEDGNQHLHVILILLRKHYSRSPVKLAVRFEGKSYNCHCTGIRNLANAVRYACKSGEYISNMKNLYMGSLVPIHELVRDMSRIEGSQRTLEYYDENFPQQAVGGKSLVST